MNIYLDNAATTPVAKEVIKAMCDSLTNDFGNPSSTHSFGRKTKGVIEMARRSISKNLNCKPSEIIFTSGGTEADNMALNAAIHDLNVKRIITSPIEHHAVLHTAEFLNKSNPIQVDYVKVDSKGNVDFEDLENLLKSEVPTLVSLMHANNEIGTKIDLLKLSNLCREHKAYLHSDTVQTMGHYPFDLEKIDIDFITCAAHKIHGPKGVGFLYLKSNLNIKPLIHGGAQERGIRGGTENLSGIVGLTIALELANKDMQSHIDHVQGLKSYMIKQLKESIPSINFHGETSPEKSLYTVLNVCFPKIQHPELLLLTLDLAGIACSGGSACSSGSDAGSHVLQGINAPSDQPNARFSFSRYTTKLEIDYAIEQIQKIIKKQGIEA